jgi:hypothetical protein
MVEVVKLLPSKREALSSNFMEKRKNKRKKEGKEGGRERRRVRGKEEGKKEVKTIKT